MSRPYDTVQAKVEIDIVDLNELKLDDRTKRNILLRVQTLTQVKSARYERGVLFCTIDVRLLSGVRYAAAVQVLKHRIAQHVDSTIKLSVERNRLTVVR